MIPQNAAEPPDTQIALLQRKRRLGLVLLVAGLPTLVVLLALCLPVIGNLVGMSLIASIADCRDASAGMYTRCELWGHDLVNIYAGYGYGIFLGGITNPVVYWMLLTMYLPGWLVIGWHVAMLWLYMEWRRARRRLQLGADGPDSSSRSGVPDDRHAKADPAKGDGKP